ncbi:MAG TPA: PASTA domain-containing protein [Bacteroidia bacterium]|jgi:beta-lactam-binding protein with PASTA domain|nr:PASTA domain-containing protein [Bacteroidia bacterium]
MKGFFSFLRSKQFFIHFGLAAITIIITLWILIKMLNSYTQHGVSVEVPDFKGKTIAELNGFIEGKDVRYLIIDSIYAPKEKPGMVIRQDPETKTQVKRNRIIYLYVTGLLPPQMAMPKLIDRSERQAILMLESYGFKIGKIKQVAGDCNGCVLGQFIKGKAVEPGTNVKKGTVIDLTIGRKDRFVTASSDTSGNSSNTNFDGE